MKSINQQCLYPGRGPIGPKNSSPECSSRQVDGETVFTNCVDVTLNDMEDTGCVYTGLDPQLKHANVESCLGLLGTDEVSQRFPSEEVNDENN